MSYVLWTESHIKNKITKILKTISNNKNNLVAAECNSFPPTNTIFIMSASELEQILSNSMHMLLDIYSFSLFTSCSYLPLWNLLQTCFQSHAKIYKNVSWKQIWGFRRLSDYLPVLNWNTDVCTQKTITLIRLVLHHLLYIRRNCFWFRPVDGTTVIFFYFLFPIVLNHLLRKYVCTHCESCEPNLEIILSWGRSYADNQWENVDV